MLCTLHGGRLDTSYVRRLLPRLAVRAGIEGKRVHAHGLRHTHAAELARPRTRRSVTVSFLGANGDLALGLALLIAAVAGALILLLIGSTRIIQLRLAVRRQRSRRCR